MALQLRALTLLGLLGMGASLRPRKADFFRSEKELNHLAVDEASGVVYVGAVNALYQLDAKLQLEQQVSTGPALDNKKCTPPIEPSQCQEAEMTDNVNQLLLLDPPRKRLVECGSLFKGICALRSLSNISERLFYEDSSGEKSFVASNDEGVATVGLVSSTGPGGDRVLFVGKGNGPYDNGMIVSTRLLDRTDGREAFEAYTDHATYKAGYLSTNTQQFVAAFEDGPYVFFVFNQQDKHPARNRTLLARMCRQDPNYYSYLEMDLQCQDPDPKAAAFGTCLAASVAAPGSGRVLYAVFSRDARSPGGPGAGLCLFPLDEVHDKMEANRNTCYTSTRDAARDIFYKPFHGEIECGGHSPVRASVCPRRARASGVHDIHAGTRNTAVSMAGLPAMWALLWGCVGGLVCLREGKDLARLGAQGSSQNFLCGSEHLPYPLGSRDGLTATAVLQRGGLNLTAVTVTTENNHTVAFLGTSDGRILKALEGPSVHKAPALTSLLSRTQVYLASNGTSSEYDSVLVEINKRVKHDLVLSGDLAILYAMTQDKVFRFPVQECLSYLTCTQCRDSQDPYCGWSPGGSGHSCLWDTGGCTRKAECPRAEEASHWLWSRSKSCVAITSAQPQNMSRRAQGEVQLTVSPLPALNEEDELLCLFGDSPPHPARVEGNTVICNSPNSIPVTPPGQGEAPSKPPSQPFTVTPAHGALRTRALTSAGPWVQTGHRHALWPLGGQA
ncbi:Plexin-B2 [Saguinus oedipus]|uniref:Plexin-B2 n=1 Tax=Saguinus oedipus TaxID=9490 RepID=A0ABQ9WJU7_SAGOE|nr:Plexin-B2 [Saguinus oedipus]